MKAKQFLLILASVILLVIGIASSQYSNSDKKAVGDEDSNAIDSGESLTKDSITISPQDASVEVTIASATLSKNGFLVVREMEDDKLSQVVEMSRPLKMGTHKNITVSLGSADVKNKDLIVMIYEDFGNDEVFNDLDMPALNENGNMTARFVKTGKPLSTSITEGKSTGMTHDMAGMKTMAKVRYTDNGFLPEKVEVPVGSTVEFINESNANMWVASMSHPAHTILPTFDQFKAYKKGSLYRYQFDKKGIWEYHDHINPSMGGVVTVK